MNYFLDTCVEIGYVFCTDKWYDKSEKLFDNYNSLYYSFCVNKEFTKKYNNFLKGQKNLFYALRDDLKKDDPNKLISLERLIIKSKLVSLQREIDEEKKEKSAKIFWKYTESKHEYDNDLNIHVCKIKYLLNKISAFIMSFEKGINRRRNIFECNVIMYPKRTDEYPNLYKKLDDSNVHYPDNCIVLDAHDLSLKDQIDLEFITADNKMVINVNKVSELLNIKKFHYLENFI